MLWKWMKEYQQAMLLAYLALGGNQRFRKTQTKRPSGPIFGQAINESSSCNHYRALKCEALN
jgi:hypothetical protein